MVTHAMQPAAPDSISRYARALESSPHLLDQLSQASGESLSLRAEVALMRVLLGELVRMMGRAAAAPGTEPSAVVAMVGLVSQQIRSVEAVVNSCAAIEAKKVDQSLDAAKLVLLITNLREELRRGLRDAGLKGGVAIVDGVFDRAKWTGALNDATVKEALQAPASFDVQFRPIERDASGKVREHARAFDTPDEALAEAGQIKATPLLNVAQPAAPAMSANERFERDKLNDELAQANAMLDAEIAAAAEAGNPLPGVSEARASKLNRLDPLKDE